MIETYSVNHSLISAVGVLFVLIAFACALIFCVDKRIVRIVSAGVAIASTLAVVTCVYRASARANSTSNIVSQVAHEDRVVITGREVAVIRAATENGGDVDNTCAAVNNVSCSESPAHISRSRFSVSSRTYPMIPATRDGRPMGCDVMDATSSTVTLDCHPIAK